MGKTSFSGPVYGSKATLWSGGPFDASTGSSFAFAGVVVPAGEDWYGTEIAVYRNSTGTNGLSIAVLDDSSVVGSVTLASTAAAGAVGVIVKDADEYEGAQIASGSTITFVHSSHAGANAGLSVTLSGFRRFITSSRAE